MRSMYSPREQAADRYNRSDEAEAYRAAHGCYGGRLHEWRSDNEYRSDNPAQQTCARCLQVSYPSGYEHGAHILPAAEIVRRNVALRLA